MLIIITSTVITYAQTQQAMNQLAQSMIRDMYESPDDKYKREFKKSIDTKIDSLLSD